MVKRIIVEGADQQGKTQFCNLLSQEIGWPIVKFDKPTADFDFFEGYLIPENSISDRNFLSEVVYSKINNKESRIVNLDELQSALEQLDTILIMLDRGDSFKFDYERHEDYTEAQINRAISIYKNEFRNIKIRKFLINPNSPNNVDVKSIITSIKHNVHIQKP